MRSTPAILAKGKTSFSVNCIICHGEKGDGTGPVGRTLNPKPRNFVAEPFKECGSKTKLECPTAQQVFNEITNGKTCSYDFGHLPEEERWGLAYYVLSFRNKN